LSNARISYSRTRPGWCGEPAAEEETVEVVRAADGGRTAADHRGVPHRRVVVHVALRHALRSVGIAVQRNLGEHRGGDDWGGTGEEAPTRKFRHD
jgi:hypothetical protein